MGRMTVTIDNHLIEEARQALRTSTKRETIELALREAVKAWRRNAALSRAGRLDLARLQLTHERMVSHLQRDVQEYLEHGSTPAAMDDEQVHVARRLRLSAGNRAIEGYRRQALPESVAHPAQVQVQKWLQFGVPMTPTLLAGRRHGASEYHEPECHCSLDESAAPAATTTRCSCVSIPIPILCACGG